jgi:hypothetical protein
MLGKKKVPCRQGTKKGRLLFPVFRMIYSAAEAVSSSLPTLPQDGQA